MLPLELSHSRGWVLDAPCREIGGEFFFPEGASSATVTPTVQAKKFCRTTCPVIDECLLAALRHNEEYGVFGGTSPKERHEMLAGRTPLPEWADDRHEQIVQQYRSGALTAKAVRGKGATSPIGPRRWADCGTPTAYQRHYRAKQPACAECRRAHADYGAMMKERIAA